MEATFYNEQIGVPLDEFIVQNSRLVHKVANRYINQLKRIGMDYEDLYQIGVMGLIKAYQKFRPLDFLKGEGGQPVKFSTYGVPMILGEIRRTLRDNCADTAGMKFSRSIKENLYLITNSDIQDNATDEEIMEATGLSLEAIQGVRAYQTVQKSRSLEQPHYTEGSGEPIYVADVLGEWDNNAEYNLMLEELLNKLDSINPKYRTILLLMMSDYTQESIGEIIGVSQVQVSRLTKSMKAHIEDYLGDRSVTTPTKKPKEEKSVRPISPEVEKVQQLLRDTAMSYRDISDVTGVSYSVVCYHGRKIRGARVTKKDEGCVVRPLTEEEKVKYGVMTDVCPTHETSDVPNPPIPTKAEETIALESDFFSSDVSLQVTKVTKVNSIRSHLDQLYKMLLATGYNGELELDVKIRNIKESAS